MDIASFIDHTYLKPDCSESIIDQMIRDAVQFGFKAICIPPVFVRYAKERSGHYPFLLAAVAGFPIGYDHLEAKLTSLRHSARDGADEVDVVVNLSFIQAAQWDLVKAECSSLQNAAKECGITLKCIIEAQLLTEAELLHICDISNEIGLDFVKTSTGFFGSPVSEEIVRLLRRHLHPSIRIKASGGIQHYEQAIQMITAGADRIGCSQSVTIVNEMSLATK